MKFMKKVIKVFTITVLTIIGLIIIAILYGLSLETAEAIDLVHKDTDAFYENYDFFDSKINEYVIGDVVFLPYITRNPYQSSEPEYSTYCLRLGVHKQKESSGKAVVNSVSVEAIQEVEFNKVFNNLNQTIVFTEDEDYQDLPTSSIILVNEINDYNMKLTEKSQIEVTLNVSVEENGEFITKDLSYIFETDIWRYPITR